jgi:hypothetical protein
MITDALPALPLLLAILSTAGGIVFLAVAGWFAFAGMVVLFFMGCRDWRDDADLAWPWDDAIPAGEPFDWGGAS